MEKDMSISAILVEFTPPDDKELLNESKEWGNRYTGLMVKINGLIKGKGRTTADMNKNRGDNQMTK